MGGAPLHELRSNSWQLLISEKGLLASLRNLRTGQEYISRPEMNLWRIIVECDSDPEMPIDSVAQEPVDIVSTGRHIKVCYRGLKALNGERLDIAFAYSVEKGQSEDELVFRAEITNHQQNLLKELWFPLINGVRSLGHRAENDFLLYPESAGRKVQNPVRNLADRDAVPVRGVKPLFLRHYYPGQASMQWMGWYGDNGSLYLGSHDDSLQTTALLAGLNVAPRPEDDSVHLGFIKYPFISNASWQSEPFVVAVHNASWHTDARRYRRWADTYQDHKGPRVQWVRRMAGMHDIILLYQHGRVNYRYDEVDKLVAAVRAGGLDVLKISGWSHGGHDSHYPDFLPSERLGGEERLIEAIRKAQRQGIKVVLYFHFVQMSPNSRFYARHGEFCAMKGPHGNPHIDIFTWPSHGTVIAMNSKFRLINACVGTAPWQEQVVRCTERGLRYGVDCVFLDQTAGAPGSYLCFDQTCVSTSGTATPPLPSPPARARWSSLGKSGSGSRPPVERWPWGPSTSATSSSSSTTSAFPSAWASSTALPTVLMTQYVSRENYRQLNYSFVMGYRFFIAPHQQTGLLTDLHPEFVSHVCALSEFRKAHAGVLLDSTFTDDTLFAIDNAEVFAKGYLGQSDGRGAVIVWNPTERVQKAEVCWPGAVLWGAASPLPGAAFHRNTVALEPDGIAVFFFSFRGQG